MGLTVGIQVNGKDKSAAFAPYFKRLVIIDVDGLSADQVQLTLHNPNLKLTLPTFGAVLKLFINDVAMGSFTVINHADARNGFVHVHASSVASASLSERKNRSFHQKTVGDIVGIIAGEHDLTPAVATSYASQTIQHLNQINESDQNLLTRLGVTLGGMAKITSNFLLFNEKNGKSASGKSAELPEHVIMPSDKLTLLGNGKMTLSTHGNPAYKAGFVLPIEGVNYLLSRVQHDVKDLSSYRCDLIGEA